MATIVKFYREDKKYLIGAFYYPVSSNNDNKPLRTILFERMKDIFSEES